MKHCVIWLSPKEMCVCFSIAMSLGLVSFVCGAMSGFEQGQISVASGQVTCVKAMGEFICEENTYESH